MSMLMSMLMYSAGRQPTDDDWRAGHSGVGGQHFQRHQLHRLRRKSNTGLYMSFHAGTVADTDPLKTILLSTISMFTRLTLNALILSGGRGLRPGWLRPGWL